jgi:hypothetical protein
MDLNVHTNKTIQRLRHKSNIESTWLNQWRVVLEVMQFKLRLCQGHRQAISGSGTALHQLQMIEQKPCRSVGSDLKSLLGQSSENFLLLPLKEILLLGITTRPVSQGITRGLVLQAQSVQVIRESNDCLVHGTSGGC